MLLQDPVPAHYLGLGGFFSFEDAVLIMHFLRSVQAETDGKILSRQKAAPIFIKEGAVSLHPVEDGSVSGQMFALKGPDLTKIIETQEGWLPAVPGKIDRPDRGRPGCAG